jgi:hypothetical protein
MKSSRSLRCSCIGFIELIPRLSELLSNHITSLHEILQAFPQRIKRRHSRILPRLDAEIHLRFRGVRYRVAAELHVWVLVDEVA